MMRALIVGLWACLSTLAGAYGGVYWRLHGAQHASEPQERVETRKIKPITVPIISNGALKGYVSAEFNIVGLKDEPNGASLDPESFILDEAFRLIYAEDKIDFTKIEKGALANLTERVTANVNQRMGRPVIKETLVKSFTFVPREELFR